MSSFAVIKLEQERLDEAYPLIRAATRVGPRRWHAYARLLAKRNGGILAVVDPDNGIHGIASYRPENTLRHSHSLIVDVVAAFEFHSGSPVRKQLCGALKQEAQRRQCRSLVITVTAPHDSSSVEDVSGPWQRLGLDLETVTFVQKVDDTPARQKNGTDQTR